MEVKRDHDSINNLVAMSFDAIKLSLRYDETENVKAILYNLYSEGYRDGCIVTLFEQKNKEKE